MNEFATQPHTAVFALGCFWGAEKLFWEVDGVLSTSVGYTAGQTENPTYEQVCSGKTGHTEAVQVMYDPSIVSYDDLLKLFWESHDPTQGDRQGNDIGNQYRSGIYTLDDTQAQHAAASKIMYEEALNMSGHSRPITTEIEPLNRFYPAEEYHQQYLQKVPNGYCNLAGTGVACPLEFALLALLNDDAVLPLESVIR